MDRLDISSGMIMNRKAVKIPGGRINLFVKESSESKGQRKHLFSDIFSGIIDKAEGIENPWILKRILNLSNSWLGETFGNRFIRRTGMRLKDGNIHFDSVTIKGKKAEYADMAIRAATLGKRYIFLFPLIVLVIYALIVITSSGIRSGLNSMGTTMKYSFMAAFVIIFGLVLISLAPWLLIDIPVKDTMIVLMVEKAISMILLYTTAPLAAAMFALSVIGSIIARLTREKKDNREDISES